MLASIPAALFHAADWRSFEDIWCITTYPSTDSRHSVRGLPVYLQHALFDDNNLKPSHILTEGGLAGKTYMLTSLDSLEIVLHDLQVGDVCFHAVGLYFSS